MRNDCLSGVRVLFTGQYTPGSNSLYIARAFERWGALVSFVDDTASYPAWVGKPGRALRRLILRPVIEAEWNYRLLRLARNFTPDLIYVTNAELCWPETLRKLSRSGPPIMCFYHDVLWRGRPAGRFPQNIRDFDLVVTTRRWQAQEFEAAGARAVRVVRFGYDPQAHRPLQRNARLIEAYGAEVTFVGTYEPYRTAQLTRLVLGEFPYSFRLWGDYWDRLPPGSPVRRYWQGRAIYEGEIAAVYAASEISLHWVGWEPNSGNPYLRQGDQHNSRTFQIAACGGAMMLAQRTDEHVEFFAEGREAVFFDDVETLREALAYWLQPTQADARRRIAAAARARCLAEDYSYAPIARGFLEYFDLPAMAG